ncbi:MAG: hypothetical protein H6574_18840 [Lewinellaceae bacterium]|nr:hypothetical protein [Saprospiraceae bacterium]MCB9314780.1 hypothetical protein [Lewinellaceae bacterium]MCB9333130.1 hypothetical protein [Lewinellaceae bacterium]
MPVEIKELVIRVSIDDSRQSSENTARPGKHTGQLSVLQREQILKAALEQTLEVFRLKKER